MFFEIKCCMECPLYHSDEFGEHCTILYDEEGIERGGLDEGDYESDSSFGTHKKCPLKKQNIIIKLKG